MIMAEAPKDHLSTPELTVVLGKRPFRYFETIGSTNDALQLWLQEDSKLASGAVVIADEQSKGRGRLQRGWHTPAGQAIAMSVLLRPAINPQYLQLVTVAAGVAVAEAVSPLVTTAVQLKWPNDVLIKERKVCGILTEALWLGDKLHGVIVGIGINVRVDFHHTELEQIATSLELYAKNSLHRATIIATVLQNLDELMPLLGTPALLKRWRQWLVTLGKPVRIQTAQGVVEGIAINVRDDGAIVVKEAQGALRHILVGDVESV